MIRMLTVAFVLAISSTSGATPIHHGCSKTFTVPMVERAIDATFKGTHNVTERQAARLRHYVGCAKHRKPFLHRYWHNAIVAWNARRNPPFTPSLASWYSDGGATACGFHAQYGVANKSLPCGTKVTFRYGHNTVTAVVDDRGPYVGGREWDLNQNTAATLGFTGVGIIGYRLG